MNCVGGQKGKKSLRILVYYKEFKIKTIMTSQFHLF